ncbi:alpha-hydroxy-acid oxidizing protein [Ponticoccus gilvus]|nr:alpha-hydroxy-acid oxidizing protein [Enemella evansiae]
MTDLSRAAEIADLRRMARKRLPRAIFDFIDGGAGAGITRAANMADFERLTLMPRMGVDVAACDTGATILGRKAPLPLILAPTGLAGLYWPEGEQATVRAAHAAGIPFCLSANSVASIEEVARAAPEAERWFQFYFLKDPGLTSRMLERARSNGYRVLCLTLDLAQQGKRHHDLRNSFTVPPRLTAATVLDALRRPHWLQGYLRHGVSFGNFESGSSDGGFASIATRVASLGDASANWETVARVAQEWGGPFVIKGLLHPDDARRAADLGAQAVIVSNHGGRQLDSVPSPIAALPAIAEAVGGRTQVILDGGVRRGTDIVKAKALGADAVMVGRAFLWGLAAAGQPGVSKAITLLAEELDNALALMGQPAYRAIDRSALA